MYHHSHPSRNLKSRLFALFVNNGQTLDLDSSTTMAEASSASSKPPASDAEIDRLLKSEANALQRQVEVSAFSLRRPYVTNRLADR